MEPNAYALDTRSELFVMKLLVESMLTALSDDQQEHVLQLFATACESSIAAMLGAAQRDTTVHAMQAAQQHQRERLARYGLQVPPLPQD